MASGGPPTTLEAPQQLAQQGIVPSGSAASVGAMPQHALQQQLVRILDIQMKTAQALKTQILIHAAAAGPVRLEEPPTLSIAEAQALANVLAPQ